MADPEKKHNVSVETVVPEDAIADDAVESGDDHGQRAGRIKASTLRAITGIAVFVLVGIGLAFNIGTGTISSFGWDYISTICPVGALESIFGAWAFVPRAIIVLVIVLLLGIVVGKAFCAWACPVPHVENIFKSKKRKALDAAEQDEAADRSIERWRKKEKITRKPVPLDSRHAVLGGTLLTTAIFGFPVFCVVCPVGLSIATFILVWRTLQFNEPSWGLLIFPLVIVLEVVVFRKWCGRLCPIGALLSLVSTLNKSFRPTVDHSVCLRDTKDANCKICDAACPEYIDPFADKGDRAMTECIKCRRCVDSCPVSAIKLPFAKKKAEE